VIRTHVASDHEAATEIEIHGVCGCARTRISTGPPLKNGHIASRLQRAVRLHRKHRDSSVIGLILNYRNAIPLDDRYNLVQVAMIGHDHA
jgi:hypothetical protein